MLNVSILIIYLFLNGTILKFDILMETDNKNLSIMTFPEVFILIKDPKLYT